MMLQNVKNYAPSSPIPASARKEPMKNAKSNLWKKFVSFAKSIWQSCKNVKTLLLFFVVMAVVYAPVWAGFLLYGLFGFRWCFHIATVCFAFWAGPFTPFFPFCIAITLFLKKLMAKWKKRHQTPETTSADTVNSPIPFQGNASTSTSKKSPIKEGKRRTDHRASAVCMQQNNTNIFGILRKPKPLITVYPALSAPMQ